MSVAVAASSARGERDVSRVRCSRLAGVLFATATGCSIALPALAWDLSGSKTVSLHTREGQPVPIGTVEFKPVGERIGFEIKLDHARFKDYFLSMREFKCLDGTGETHCHVPYPYKMPATVSANDLRWLEHSLLFLFNVPRDYGAKLANGLYYQMAITGEGIVGTPQSVDLAQIGAPPADPSVPPFAPEDRSNIVPEQRWFTRLTIQ